MKSLDNLMRKIPEFADRYCKKIADSIDNKATQNLLEAMSNVSDIIDVPIVYTRKDSTKDDVIYTVTAFGSQLGFIEFGTGVTTDRYPWGITIYDYVPSILHEKDLARGSYGKGNGKREKWGFYPTYSGNVATNNGDFLATYRVKHRKDGSIKTYPLKKPVIITKGLSPSRAIYRAVRDTIKETDKYLEYFKSYWGS